MLSYIDENELWVKNIYKMASAKFSSFNKTDEDGNLRIKLMKTKFLNMATEEYFKIATDTGFPSEHSRPISILSRLSIYKNSSTRKLAQLKPPCVAEDLTVYPPTCWIPRSGGSSTHTLINAGPERLMFKLEFTNNKRYSTSQEYGFIEPYGYFDILIQRKYGLSKKSKLIVHFGVALSDGYNAMDSFKKNMCIDSIHLPLTSF